MLRLASLECHHCQLQYNSKSTRFICDFGDLICERCQTKELELGNIHDKKYVTNLNLDYLLQFAVVTELKFLNFENWSPFACFLCRRTITTERPAGYVSRSELACAECACHHQADTTQHDVNISMKIINELSIFFSTVGNKAVMVNKKVNLQSLTCSKCGQESNIVNFTPEGELSCVVCLARNKQSCQIVPEGSCLRLFNWMICRIVNSDELKFLTHSKWTSLRCEDCSIPFSENRAHLPVFLPSCGKVSCSSCVTDHVCENCQGKERTTITLYFLIGVIMEFRQLFRKGDFGCEEDFESDTELPVEDLHPRIVEDGLSSPIAEHNMPGTTREQEQASGSMQQEFIPQFEEQEFPPPSVEKDLTSAPREECNRDTGEEELVACSQEFNSHYDEEEFRSCSDGEDLLSPFIAELNISGDTSDEEPASGPVRQESNFHTEEEDFHSPSLDEGLDSYFSEQHNQSRNTGEQELIASPELLPQSKEDDERSNFVEERNSSHDAGIQQLASCSPEQEFEEEDFGSPSMEEDSTSPPGAERITRGATIYEHLSTLSVHRDLYAHSEDEDLHYPYPTSECRLSPIRGKRTNYVARVIRAIEQKPASGSVRQSLTRPALENIISPPTHIFVREKFRARAFRDIQQGQSTKGAALGFESSSEEVSTLTLPEFDFRHVRNEYNPALVKKRVSLPPKKEDFICRAWTGYGKPNALISDLKCLICDQSNDAATTFACLSCEQYGFCAGCVISHHWGHSVEDASRKILTVLALEKHDKTFGKLVKWHGQLEHLHKQGIEVHRDICESYKLLFTRAIKGDDAELVRALNSEGNVLEMQDYVKDFINRQIRFISAAIIFNEKLKNILDDAEERDDLAEGDTQ